MSILDKLYGFGQSVGDVLEEGFNDAIDFGRERLEQAVKIKPGSVERGTSSDQRTTAQYTERVPPVDAQTVSNINPSTSGFSVSPTMLLVGGVAALALVLVARG